MFTDITCTLGRVNALGLLRRMSVDTDNCNCGPDPVSIEESPSPTVVVDEENLLKMLEEQNK